MLISKLDCAHVLISTTTTNMTGLNRIVRLIKIVQVTVKCFTKENRPGLFFLRAMQGIHTKTLCKLIFFSGEPHVYNRFGQLVVRFKNRLIFHYCREKWVSPMGSWTLKIKFIDILLTCKKLTLNNLYLYNQLNSVSS